MHFIYRLSPELRQTGLQACPNFFPEKFYDTLTVDDVDGFFKALSKEKLTLDQLNFCKEILGVLASMIDPKFSVTKGQKKFSSANKAKLTLLTMAAILFAAFEGFDNVVTLLSIFPIAATALLATGVVFSCLSIFISCSFELFQLKKHMNSEEELLQCIQEQLLYIKVIRKKISESKKNLCDEIVMYIKETKQGDLETKLKTLDTLKDNLALLEVLEQHLQNLMIFNPKSHLTQDIHPFLKWPLTAATSLLFFSSGFCAGQMVGQFCLGFFYASIAANALPVVLIGVVVGLVALSLSYSVRFPDLKKIVLGWSGRGKDSLQQSYETAEREMKKLSSLRNSCQVFFKERSAQPMPTKSGDLAFAN